MSGAINLSETYTRLSELGIDGEVVLDIQVLWEDERFSQRDNAALRDIGSQAITRERDVTELVQELYTTGVTNALQSVSLLRAAGHTFMRATALLAGIEPDKPDGTGVGAVVGKYELAYGYCVRCGRTFDKDELSVRGICSECSAKAQYQNLWGLRNKSGPYYEQWLESMRNWVDDILYGDEPEQNAQTDDVPDWADDDDDDAAETTGYTGKDGYDKILF